MDYKKEIIEMIENTENEGKLKFVYTILIKYLKSKSKGINPCSFCLVMKLFVLLLSYLLYRVLCIPR